MYHLTSYNLFRKYCVASSVTVLSALILLPVESKSLIFSLCSLILALRKSAWLYLYLQVCVCLFLCFLLLLCLFVLCLLTYFVCLLIHSSVSLHNLCIYCREYLILAKSWGLAKIMFASGNFVHLTLWKEVFPLLRQLEVFVSVSAY